MMVRSPRVWNCSRLALPDILDPGIDGLEAGKLVNDQAIGVGVARRRGRQAHRPGPRRAAQGHDRLCDRSYYGRPHGDPPPRDRAQDHEDGGAPRLREAGAPEAAPPSNRGENSFERQ